MNINAKINLTFIIISITIFSILFLYPLIIATTTASLNITTYGVRSGNQTVNEDISYNFNFTINHSGGSLAARNLTGVNITLPSVFTFTSGTNGSGNLSATDGYSSSAVIYFTNFSSQLLQWNTTGAANNIVTINATAGFVEGKNYTFIWFNSSAATPGKYNITLRFIHNGSVGGPFNETNITVIINDTTIPYHVNITNLTLTSNGSELSPTYANVTGRITLNISALDNGNFSLGNSQFTEIVEINATIFDNTSVVVASYNLSNVTQVGANGNYWNVTINTSAIADGRYNITLYVKDQGGNVNSTVNISNIVFDASGPSVTVTCTDTTAGSAFPCSCSSQDVLSGVASSSDSSTSPDNTGIAANTGSFTYSCTATNYAGVSTTATTTYQVTQSGSGSSGSGGGSSDSSTTSEYTKTIVIDEDFNKVTSSKQELGKKERVRVELSPSNSNVKETHYVGVKDISATSATVEITSTPVLVELMIGQEKSVDLDNDGIYDLKITLHAISATKKASLTIASLREKILKAPTEEIVEEETTPTESGVEEKSSSNLLLWIGILIIAVFVALGVIFIKRHNN